MSRGSQELSLGEAASLFLVDLPPEERGPNQQEISRFIRWFGSESSFSGIAPAGVEKYAKQLSLSDTDFMTKLDLIRSFLVYVRKKGWSGSNLSVHLKARKGKTKLRTSQVKALPEAILLTQQRYTELENEVVALQNKSLELIEEMRLAAADKDFRENVPLQAAREQRGQIEGRIMELQETLKFAVISDGKKKKTLTVEPGDSVVLLNLDSGEEQRYTLVSSKEVDPRRGKISSSSPVGRAVVGKNQGEIVEVTVPAGKLRYQIKQVER